MANEQQTSYLDLPDDQLGMPPTIEETVVEETPEVTEESTDNGAVEVIDGGEVEEKVEEQPTVTETPETITQETPEQKNIDNSEKVTETVDYKAAYEKLTAPFKANGKEITVQNVDDAITLMQMGVNYNKKMASLKPHLRMLKMLEKAQLLDESKLSYLIDLNSKDPQAIAKLVKDSNMDVMEMDSISTDDYHPKSRRVDDKEIELDEVLAEIKDTPTYSNLLNVVSTKWDSKSQQTIADTPSILKILNTHMENGIYDLIHKEMESEKVFGRLNGLSDLEAYRKIGDAIQARGGFNFLAQKSQTTPLQNVTTKPVQAQDDKLKDKKRAAAPVKSVTSTQMKADFNPLALSDEEFSKLAKSKYM